MARKRQSIESLTYQIKKNLDSKLRIGTKKYEDRKKGVDTSKYIYSWSTYNSYMENSNYFKDWLKENHPNIKTIEEARPLVEAWLTYRMEDKKDSASTLKLKRSTMAKLYDCKGDDFNISLPVRRRQDIKRSRYDVAMDKEFSTTKNAKLISFCKSTGVRRHELKGLKGGTIVYIDGMPHLEIVRGKGGRQRYAPIIGTEAEISAVVALVEETKVDCCVFPKVPIRADIHSYRRCYANAIYNNCKRDVKTLKREEIYYCRNDLKGVHLDREALIKVSFALGHGKTEKPRPGIVATNYIDLNDFKI